MRIRASQLKALESSLLIRFVNEMCLYLRTALPLQTGRADEAELKSAVEQTIEQGRIFGIEERFDLQQYLKIVFELGRLVNPKTTLDWATDFLGDPAIPAADKVNLLECEAIMRGFLKR